MSVVTVTDSNWSSGAGAIDSYNSLITGIKNAHDEDKGVAAAEIGVAVFSVVVDTVAFALNPLSKLIAAGLGWLIEHVEFLKKPLDWLAGNPDGIKALADDLHKIGQDLRNAATDMDSNLKSTLSGWTGEAADAYRKNLGDRQADIDGAGHSVDIAGYVVETTMALIAAVRALIRDMITSTLGDIISTMLIALASAPFTFGASIAVGVGKCVVEGIAKVAEMTAKLAKLIGFSARVVKRIEDLVKVLQKTATKLDVKYSNLRGIPPKTPPAGGVHDGNPAPAPPPNTNPAGDNTPPPANTHQGDPPANTNTSGANPNAHDPNTNPANEAPPPPANTHQGEPPPNTNTNPANDTPPPTNTGGGESSTGSHPANDGSAPPTNSNTGGGGGEPSTSGGTHPAGDGTTGPPPAGQSGHNTGDDAASTHSNDGGSVYHDAQEHPDNSSTHSGDGESIYHDANDHFSNEPSTTNTGAHDDPNTQRPADQNTGQPPQEPNTGTQHPADQNTGQPPQEPNTGTQHPADQNTTPQDAGGGGQHGTGAGEGQQGGGGGQHTEGEGQGAPHNEGQGGGGQHTEGQGGGGGEGKPAESLLKPFEHPSLKKHEDWLKANGYGDNLNTTKFNEKYLQEHNPKLFTALKTIADLKSSKNMVGLTDKYITQVVKQLADIQQKAQMSWDDANIQWKKDHPDSTVGE